MSYTTHAHSAYPCTSCAVERAQGCRSIWEHPTMHTYDPWGLGSGQSERTNQIARAGGDIIRKPTFGGNRWKPREKDVLKLKKNQKMRDVKRMMFYCHTKFQVETWYVSIASTFPNTFTLVLDSNLHDLNGTNPGLTLFSAELPWCYFCAEINVPGMTWKSDTFWN